MITDSIITDNTSRRKPSFLNYPINMSNPIIGKIMAK